MNTRHHSERRAARAILFKATLCFAAIFSGQRAVAQTPIPPAAVDFANSAAQSDEYEIQAARDVIAQSRDARIRGFAQQMIQDHTRMDAGLRQAAAVSGLPSPPHAMSGDQAMMLSALQSLRGPQFDKAYAKQQVLAHQQALAVQQSYADSGSDANLRKAAQTAVPMIQEHLKAAQAINAALHG